MSWSPPVQAAWTLIAVVILTNWFTWGRRVRAWVVAADRCGCCWVPTTLLSAVVISWLISELALTDNARSCPLWAKQSEVDIWLCCVITWKWHLQFTFYFGSLKHLTHKSMPLAGTFQIKWCPKSPFHKLYWFIGVWWIIFVWVLLAKSASERFTSWDIYCEKDAPKEWSGRHGIRYAQFRMIKRGGIKTTPWRGRSPHYM